MARYDTVSLEGGYAAKQVCVEREFVIKKRKRMDLHPVRSFFLPSCALALAPLLLLLSLLGAILDIMS